MTGNSQTGVDVMCMDAGLDTGPIAMREITPIRPHDTAGDLTSRLAAIAAHLSLSALRSLEAGLLTFQEQSAVGVCYSHKIKKSEAEIDWARSAETIRNQIHGLSSAPGAFSKLPIGNRNENIKFLRAEVATGTGPPGTLLSEDMTIACGEGAIRVLQGQRSGRSVTSGRELMRGARLAPGVIFTRSRASFVDREECGLTFWAGAIGQAGWVMVGGPARARMAACRFPLRSGPGFPLRTDPA